MAHYDSILLHQTRPRPEESVETFVFEKDGKRRKEKNREMTRLGFEPGTYRMQTEEFWQ